jgi:hypothetical protein
LGVIEIEISVVALEVPFLYLPGRRQDQNKFGDNDLADLCQTLETAGKAEDWDEIDKAAPRLPGTIQRVVEYIDNL